MDSTVYIVWKINSGAKISGIFTTREEAERHIDSLTPDSISTYSIQSWLVRGTVKYPHRCSEVLFGFRCNKGAPGHRGKHQVFVDHKIIEWVTP